MRYSAFELLDERSCDMGPPSSAKMLVENLRACPVGAVCASVSAEWAWLVLAPRVGNFRLQLGLVGDSCKKVRSGEIPDVTPPMIKLFVPEIFIASIAYHAVILLHTVRGPCSETRVLSVATVVCRPYLCQVDRTIANSSMPVLGRLRCVRLITLEV
ncbi:hypothetical protein B296_00028373 [Ensete ventricosum]|uniref:Uncharacterized protein n=1 Tax=Ensete ventricosum TaxID=4639 RepID=A0A426X8B0_ENSVE|nr:hypothetical protein B296_00028373 [Ensete ventricosum]